jgi:DNA polymerase-3 subunit gamma/tau
VHESLNLKGLVRMLASNCAFDRRDGHALHFVLDARAESYLTRARRDELAKALSESLGTGVQVEIAVGRPETAPTPIQAASAREDQRLEAAKRELESDPNVQTLKSVFGAEIKPDSIKPLNGQS